MKRPQPDIGDILRASFINDISTINKLKRFWSTTTVNGVEVFKHRQYFYPDHSRGPDFEDLFKFLGAYESVTTFDPKGVESSWMYFNKNNNTILSTDYADFITSNLNQLWWDDADGVRPIGLTLTTSIVIEAKQTSSSDSSVRTSELLDPNWPKAQLIQVIEDNYEDLWATCLISQQGVGVINKGSITDPITEYVTQDEDDLSPNDPWLEVISRYALRTYGIPCTIKDVDIGIGIEGPRMYNTYIVTLEIPYNAFSPGELFVSEIVNDLETVYSTPELGTRLSYSNGYWTKKAIRSMDKSGLEDGTVVTRPYRLWETEAAETSALFDALWYNYDNTWYLKAVPFSDPSVYGLTHRQLMPYVLQLIDSDYQKKKVKWYKKVIAAIIFVVAVLLAPITAGASVALAVAQAIVFGALVLNLATAVLSAIGSDDWASAFASASKAIAPLVQLANIYIALTGLADLASSVGNGTVDAFISGEITSFVDDIIKGAVDVMGGNIATNAAVAFMTKAVDLLTLPQRNKLSALQDRNKDLKAEYDKLAEESSKEHNILQGFSRLYAKPATADWSMYASLYDTPYERGGGNLAMGNVQKTTKQALRKADYKDPMFESILIM
jgi:hypothetical protein